VVRKETNGGRYRRDLFPNQHPWGVLAQASRLIQHTLGVKSEASSLIYFVQYLDKSLTTALDR
jgi:hypothetical protein